MDRRIIGPLIFVLLVLIAGAILLRSLGNGVSILRGLPNVAGMATATPVGATSQNVADPNAPQQTPVPATPVPPPPTPTAAVVNITPVPVNEVTAIPAPTTDPSTVPPDSGDSGGDTGDAGLPCNTRVTHIVRAGENLFRIALRYRTTAAAVARLNGITNVRRVSVGQRLRIITCGRGYSSGGSIGRGATYTVQPGDTIFRIALRYGVNVQYLCRVNGLYSNLIVPGQTLIIP